MNDSDISDLARMLPVPDARDFQAGRQQTLKEYLMNEFRIAGDHRAGLSPARETSDQALEHLTAGERCSDVAPPTRLRRTGARVMAGRRHVMAVASAAAALVLLGGAGYIATTGLTGHAGHASGTAKGQTVAYTAVRGCHGLFQATGTLSHAGGGSLVIKTASGQSVTVNTTASTGVHIMGAPPSDITDGAHVLAVGTSSGGTIAASRVRVGSPLPSFGGAKGTPTLETGGYTGVQGTAANVSASGFTVVTSSGTHVSVTTSSNTVVNLDQASLSQLLSGAYTVAFGHAGPNGSLSAMGVFQPQAGTHPTLVTGGCSPASIDAAMGATG